MKFSHGCELLHRVITTIKDYQIKWWQCVGRIEDQPIPKILFIFNPAGKRDPGRPQKRREV
jgi:hypothetical protein